MFPITKSGSRLTVLTALVLAFGPSCTGDGASDKPDGAPTDADSDDFGDAGDPGADHASPLDAGAG